MRPPAVVFVLACAACTASNPPDAGDPGAGDAGSDGGSDGGSHGGSADGSTLAALCCATGGGLTVSPDSWIFSPDGTHVIVQGEADGGVGGVWAGRVDTASPQPLTRLSTAGFVGVDNIGYAKYSADAATVAFRGQAEGDDTSSEHLYVASSDGSGAVALDDGIRGFRVRGGYLCYERHTTAGPELYVAPFDLSGGKTLVTYDEAQLRIAPGAPRVAWKSSLGLETADLATPTSHNLVTANVPDWSGWTGDSKRLWYGYDSSANRILNTGELDLAAWDATSPPVVLSMIAGGSTSGTSPDGRFVTFAERYPDKLRLVVHPAAAASSANDWTFDAPLTADNVEHFAFPSFTHDGSRLLFVVDDGAATHLWSVATGAAPGVTPTEVGPPMTDGPGLFLVWNFSEQAGKAWTFPASVGASPNGELVLAPLTGGPGVKVVDNPRFGGTGPALSPGGTRLLYELQPAPQVVEVHVVPTGAAGAAVTLDFAFNTFWCGDDHLIREVAVDADKVADLVATSLPGGVSVPLATHVRHWSYQPPCLFSYAAPAAGGFGLYVPPVR